MDTDAGDPYASILSFCRIPCFQPPGAASLPPPPPPPLHSDYPLFGPIPDHLLPKYLCLTPHPTPQPPLDNTARDAAYTSASFEDSYQNITSTAFLSPDDVMPPSPQPEKLSRVSILTSSHRDAETSTIQNEAPVSCAVSLRDSLPQGDKQQTEEEQHHVAAQQHQNYTPITPMLCVESYQDSVPSTPELTPEEDYSSFRCCEMADDQPCKSSSLFLSKLRSIAVSPQAISCAPDVNIATFVAKFRNAAFLLQGQSVSRSMSLLRSELDRVSVSVSRKDKNSPSSAKYFTRSQSKLVNANADNFGFLSDYPSTLKKRKNLSGDNSSMKPKGSDLLLHGNHLNQNYEGGSSITSRGNQIFTKGGSFTFPQSSVLGLQSELSPKKRLLLDSSGPLLKNTRHSSSCCGHDSLTNGAENIAATHRVVGPCNSHPYLGFQTMALQALKIIRGMNFEGNASDEDNTENTCVTPLHDFPSAKNMTT